jgi:hypothetical protein
VSSSRAGIRRRLGCQVIRHPYVVPWIFCLSSRVGGLSRRFERCRQQTMGVTRRAGRFGAGGNAGGLRLPSLGLHSLPVVRRLIHVPRGRGRLGSTFSSDQRHVGWNFEGKSRPAGGHRERNTSGSCDRPHVSRFAPNGLFSFGSRCAPSSGSPMKETQRHRLSSTSKRVPIFRPDFSPAVCCNGRYATGWT